MYICRDRRSSRQDWSLRRQGEAEEKEKGCGGRSAKASTMVKQLTYKNMQWESRASFSTMYGNGAVE